jgi:hypothetical protein
MNQRPDTHRARTRQAGDPRPTLTVALIVLNEERNLRELLPTLSWADELVVVDGGSEDASPAAAREHGARVVSRRFEDFAIQRNTALESSSGDWVLFIDADERPMPAMPAELRERVQSPRCDAYRVPIRSSLFGRAVRRGGTQNDRPVRLVRRGRGRWRGGVHEVLVVAGRVGTLRHGLTHDTQQDLETFLTKMHRYTRLEAVARVRGGRRPRRGAGPARAAVEVFRRLVWKQGALDGPPGWKFALLSGLYEWVLAREHHRQWALAHATPLGSEGDRHPLRSERRASPRPVNGSGFARRALPSTGSRLPSVARGPRPLRWSVVATHETRFPIDEKSDDERG